MDVNASISASHMLSVLGGLASGVAWEFFRGRRMGRRLFDLLPGAVGAAVEGRLKMIETAQQAHSQSVNEHLQGVANSVRILQDVLEEQIKLAQDHAVLSSEVSTLKRDFNGLGQKLQAVKEACQRNTDWITRHDGTSSAGVTEQ